MKRASRREAQRLLIVALGAVVLVSCSPTRFSPPVDALTDAEQLIARATERSAGVRSLVTDARVEYYGEDGVRKGLVVIATRRPASVRFEALSPTGDFLAILVSDGASFVSFQRGDDRCYIGPACPLNVGRLLPLALPGDAIVRVLLGDAPLIDHDSAELEFNRTTGRYDLTLAAPSRGERQRVSYDTEDLAPREITVWRKAAIVYRVKFERLRSLGDVRVPRRIHFFMPSREIDLSLAYREVERDTPGVDDATFQFDCPQGTQRWLLGCDGSSPRPAPPSSDLLPDHTEAP